MADTSKQKDPKRKSKTKSSSLDEKEQRRSSDRPRRLAPDERESYVHLRIALDSFQTMALSYFAAGTSSKERKSRSSEIRQAIRYAINPWTKTFKDIGIDGCIPGTYDCYGECIPIRQVCG
jgi:hypothetical protein